MKKLLFLVLGIMMSISTANALEPINFEWICNTDNPAGYRIHWANVQGGPYEAAIDVGLPIPDADGMCYFSLTEPPPRMNWYRATAYDADGFSSDYSPNEPNIRSKHFHVRGFDKRAKK